MASEVSTADPDRDLARRVAELERDLTEARDQRNAIGDILRSMSSAADLQSVLDALVKSAALFGGADDATILRLKGDALLAMAHHGPITMSPGFITPLTGTASGSCVLERRPIHVADIEAVAEEFPIGITIARQFGFRTYLVVPLLLKGVVIGTIGLRRIAVEPFADKQIALLETFADQAVIAIENTRLFEAEQARAKELQEALAHQTATAEVLNVISRSPTRLAPVFDTIVASAASLCGASASNILLYDGRNLDVIATHNYTPETISLFRRMYPMAPSRSQAAGRAILSRTIVQIADTLLDCEYSKEMVQVGRFRSILSVPMLRHDEP